MAVALAPGSAAACSCVEITAADAFAAHAAVFEGRVLEVRRPEDPSGALVAVIEVVQQWKGVSSERVEVSTPAATSLCGIPFEPQTSWLIYADGEGAALTTDLCQRTRRIEDAAEDLAEHGAGVVPVEVGEDDEVEAPAPDEPPARGGCGSCAGAPGGSGAAAWIGAAALLLVTRRSRTARGASGDSPAARR